MNTNIIIAIAVVAIVVIALVIFVLKKKGANKQSVSITSGSVKSKFSLSSLFASSELNDEFYASFEKVLIKGDVGYDLTKDIINVRETLIKKQ